MTTFIYFLSGHADGESDTESSYSNDSSEMKSIQNRYRSLSVSAGYLSKSEVRSEQVRIKRSLQKYLKCPFYK